MNHRLLVSLLVFIILLIPACQSSASSPAAEASPAAAPLPTATPEIAATEVEPDVVSLVVATEPGEPLTVTARVVDEQTGAAIPQAELYARQTDEAGQYQEDTEGVPRIHGRLQTDAAGQAQFRTILPGRYPEDPTASRHIHLTVTAVGYEPLERVLLFDNDPYLTAEERTFEFSVVAPMVAAAGGGWTAQIELALRPQAAARQTFELAAGAASYQVEEEFLDVPDWLARHGLTAGLATAVGTTEAVTGELQIDLSQTPPLLGDGSFTVDLMSLTSDQAGRDNSVRRELFGDGRFPTATFVPQSLADFPAQFGEGETVTFQLVGALTIHEQTQTVPWAVTAVWQANTLTGTATTHILLGDFGLKPPSLLGLLTVSEQVRLDLQFRLQAVE